jgi:hypothetical protein
VQPQVHKSTLKLGLCLKKNNKCVLELVKEFIFRDKFFFLKVLIIRDGNTVILLKKSQGLLIGACGLRLQQGI